MVTHKGAALEELVRAYFARQGFFVVRSVPYRFGNDDVTDLDVWMYSRQAASARFRAIVDVKNKKTPKAFERILWTKGLQAALGCDRAFVATTDTSASMVQFAQSQKVAVLSKSFLERLSKKLEVDSRLTLEQFTTAVQQYRSHKQDGDWLGVLRDAKSAVASLSGFPAFNKTMLAFSFFASRAEIRLQHRDLATRCALLSAALACIALDGALERFVFDDVEKRFAGLIDGVTYGDGGDGRVKSSIDTALSVIAEGMANGRAVASQAREQLARRFAEIRADVIAEHFMREHNAQHLFVVARELDERAHAVGDIYEKPLSVEARSILGVFADFVAVKRLVVFRGSSHETQATAPQSQVEGNEAAVVAPPSSSQQDLL